MKKPKTALSSRSPRKRAGQHRPLHRRVGLHPLTILAVLIATVVMVGSTYYTWADRSVVAIVHAPPPTAPATMSDPQDGATVTSSPITVSGSCPANTYVNLLTDQVFAGTSPCHADLTYTIVTDLTAGLNSLQVQDYNLTDDPGPATPATHITYTPPTPPVTTPPATTPSSYGGATKAAAPGISTGEPLSLTTQYHYIMVTQSDMFDWVLDLEGGTPPYHVHVTWGDNLATDYTFPLDPQFHISHHYTQDGYYDILVRSVDNTGDVRTIQLAAYIGNPSSTKIPTYIGDTGSSGPNVSSTPGTGLSGWLGSLHNSSSSWLLVAWPSLLIVILMIVSFWLGERREFEQLRLKRHKRATPHNR